MRGYTVTEEIKAYSGIALGGKIINVKAIVYL